MWFLLSNAVTAVQPLAIDVMGSVCHSHTKIQDMVRDTPVNVKQELMMAPIFSHVPVDPEKAQDALTTAPQVGKVVAQPPPKPQSSKSSSSSVLAKPKSAPQQAPTLFPKRKSSFWLHVQGCLSFPGHKKSQTEGLCPAAHSTRAL